MSPKEAVTAARAHFLDIVAEPPSLEELWFDDSLQEWCVTFGVRRRLVAQSSSILSTSQQLKEVVDYKVVRIKDTDGSFVSILNREGQRAA